MSQRLEPTNKVEADPTVEAAQVVNLTTEVLLFPRPGTQATSHEVAEVSIPRQERAISQALPCLEDVTEVGR